MVRLRAALLALFFFLSTLTSPARAFAPLPIAAAALAGGGGGSMSLFSAAAASSGSYLAAGFAGALGAVGLYLTIQDAQDNAVRIPLGPNANNQPPAPAAATSVAPTSSSGGWTINASGQCLGGFSQSGLASQEAGIAALAAAYNGSSACTGNGVYSYSSNGMNVCYSNNGGPLTCYAPTGVSFTEGGAVLSCPGGYTVSGSSCVLSNARQVSDDKTCDLLISNGQFATADDMNCGASADGSKLSPLLRDGKVIAYGTNSSGQPIMFSVTPGAQTYTIQVAEQLQGPTQTQVATTTATVSAATGQVTSVQTQTAPGSIAAPSGGTVPTTTATSDATNTPQVSTQNSDPLVFPDDYARRGEAASAANTIKTAIDALKDTPDVQNPEIAVPLIGDVKAQFYGDNNKVTGLLGWTVPSHTSQCPTASLSVTVPFNWSGVLDGHCSIAETIRGTAAVIFDAVYIVLAFFILLGA